MEARVRAPIRERIASMRTFNTALEDSFRNTTGAARDIDQAIKYYERWMTGEKPAGSRTTLEFDFFVLAEESIAQAKVHLDKARATEVASHYRRRKREKILKRFKLYEGHVKSVEESFDRAKQHTGLKQSLEDYLRS